MLSDGKGKSKIRICKICEAKGHKTGCSRQNKNITIQTIQVVQKEIQGTRKMKISKHISFKEATFSSTAIRKGIDNTPNAYQLQNMQLLADKIFEPLREWAGSPIAVNSFFRSEALNKAIKGAKGSQHIQGRAIDIDDTLGGKSNNEMFEFITKNLDFDQIIWEFGNDKNPDWIHVSYVGEDQNRKAILRAKKVNGKTHYEKFV